MGFFDLLRGFVPSAAQQLARNSWVVSANPPPSWFVDPAAYDGTEVAAPMPSPDQPAPSFDDIREPLLAGATSRIGPEHFTLNPDNWALSGPSPVESSLPMRDYDASRLLLHSGNLNSLQPLSQPAAAPTSFQFQPDVVSNDLAPPAQQIQLPSDVSLVAASAAAPALPFFSGFPLADLLPAGAAIGLPLLAGLGTFLYPSSTSADDTCENGRCGGVYNREEEGAAPADSAEPSTQVGTPDVDRVSAPANTPQKDIVISKGKYPQTTGHIEDAIDSGHPDVLTIGRGGRPERGKDALRDAPRQPGLDRDEYPPKMFEEGGEGASVRPISPSDNRGAGACIGAQCRGLPDGTKVRIRDGTKVRIRIGE